MEATNETGNTLLTDGNPEIGGNNAAFRPMQMLLAAIGGCSSIDIIHLLKKQRAELRDLQIRVEGTRQEGAVPNLFTAFHVRFDLYGNVEERKAERAVRLSMEKYCSVAKTLEQTAPITWEYHLHE